MDGTTKTVNYHVIIHIEEQLSNECPSSMDGLLVRISLTPIIIVFVFYQFRFDLHILKVDDAQLPHYDSFSTSAKSNFILARNQIIEFKKGK